MKAHVSHHNKKEIYSLNMRHGLLCFVLLVNWNILVPVIHTAQIDGPH